MGPSHSYPKSQSVLRGVGPYKAAQFVRGLLGEGLLQPQMQNILCVQGLPSAEARGATNDHARQNFELGGD